MATIKATCPMCGDVDLTPRQVRVRVVEAIEDGESRRTYAFACPACAVEVEKAKARAAEQTGKVAKIMVETTCFMLRTSISTTRIAR